MKTPQRLAVLAAATLVLAACGGAGGDGEAGAEPSLPSAPCEALAVKQPITEAFGAPELITDTVEESGGTTVAHCVWLSPPNEDSEAGSTVEVSISINRDATEVDKLWDASLKDVAPPSDWRPSGSIVAQSVTPTGRWEVAKGSDFSIGIAGTDTTRLLSIRTARGASYVAHVAVGTDTTTGSNEVPSALVERVLAAVPEMLY